MHTQNNSMHSTEIFQTCTQVNLNTCILAYVYINTQNELHAQTEKKTSS